MKTVRVAIHVPDQPRYRNLVVFPADECHRAAREGQSFRSLDSWATPATVIDDGRAVGQIPARLIGNAYDALIASTDNPGHPELSAKCRRVADSLRPFASTDDSPLMITRDSAGEARVSVPMSVLMGAITELRRHASMLGALDQTLPAGQVRELVAQLEGSFIAATEPPKEEVPGNGL